MQGPVAAMLKDGKCLHLQHGPIDLLIEVDAADRDAAFRAAIIRFQTVLTELVSELPKLRKPAAASPMGIIAKRMSMAILPHAKATFVTPMAAVAGAVADEVLTVMHRATPMRRAFVNNGGDIALFLSENVTYRTAIATDRGGDLGRIQLCHADGIGGIATSGQGGRSLSFGIADAVTVLAKNAADADVAATLIANAVDLPGHPNIARVAAQQLDPDSDLGVRLVVNSVGSLDPAEVEFAMERGLKIAQKMHANGQISGAALFLRGQSCIVGLPGNQFIQQRKTLENA